MSFTIQRILGPALVMVLGLLFLTPSAGLAQPRPDLVVSFLSEPPATAFPGNGFVMTARVSNQGPVGANVSITKFDLIRTPGGAVKNLQGVQNISALLAGGSDESAVTVAIYSDTLPGTYQVRACANSVAPKIPEFPTTNNCRLSGTITVLDVPDLVVTFLSPPPPVVPQGQGFTLTYTVQNTGPVSAGASRVKFSLVGATQIDLKADEPTDLQMGTLAAGATFTHAVPLIVRPETVPGLYGLRLCADAGKTVSESSEDNCKTLLGAVQVTPQPDLVVTKVAATGAPLTVEQGEPLTIEVVVRNNGLRDADPSTLKFVLVSTGATPLQKNLKGTVAVPAVPAGTKAVLNAIPSVYEETLPGTYILQGCVDSKKVVAESFENNNCLPALGTVTVTGLELSPADLAVTALTPPPASRLPGETFALTATVVNHGPGASPIPTSSKFNLVSTTGTLRKNLKGIQILPALAKDAVDATPVTIAVYSDTVPGDYHLQACADGSSELREINEADNCRTATGVITILPVPDLVVTKVGDPPAAILPGRTFPLTETVENVGPVGALASVVEFLLVSTVAPTVRFELSGSQDVPPLASLAKFEGPSLVVKVRPETLPGPYRVQACADAKKVILEGNEDTNCALSAGVVEVAAVPDLIVNAVKLPTGPVTVVHGGTVSLTAVVKNQGLGNAGASSVRFSLVVTPGAAPIKKMPEVVPVLAVAPGLKQPTTATVTIPTSTPPGTYLVQACVDTGKVVEESSESNNCGTSSEAIQIQ